MQIYSHNIVHFVMAALMLVQTSFVHGISHAHEGGSEDHDHATPVATDHDHHPDHDHDHDAAEHALEASTRLQPATVRHTHIVCLGFEFTLPDSVPSPPDDTPSDVPSFLRLVDDCAIKLIPSSFDMGCDRAHSLHDSVCEPVTTHGREAAWAQVLGGPLCDAARFERSGVLRI